MKKVVRYRHVGKNENFTPLMFLPMQQTVIDVAEGETIEQALRRDLDILDMLGGEITDIESWDVK